MANTRTPADFPPAVHRSLALLQKQSSQRAKASGLELRHATEDEIELAHLLLKPWHCGALTIRTGLPCRKQKVFGCTVCLVHGAKYAAVKEARDRRLQLIAGPVLGEMVKMAMAKKHSRVKQNAAADLLDRAGVGAITEAKVRASYRGQPLSGVTVQIGFLQTRAAQPLEGDLANGQALLPAAGVIDGETAEAAGDRGAGDHDPAVVDAGRDRAE